MAERNQQQGRRHTCHHVYAHDANSLLQRDYQCLRGNKTKWLTHSLKLKPVSWGEFLRWLARGLWFHIACFAGHNRQEFWSERTVDKFDGSPVRFHKFMSQRRFDCILQCLTLTKRAPPSCRDKFHGVRDLVGKSPAGISEGYGWYYCFTPPPSGK